ncbi:MAG: hypothetical protein NVSMB47_19670 [Polyangiales bacterium]
MRRIALTFVAASILTVAGAASARTVNVNDAAALTYALGGALPGDEIVLADGTYHFTASQTCGASGTAAAPIVIRAKNPLGARIEFDALEGFHVTGPHWRFEGLDVHGVCADDNNCEHAFHVTGAATDFVIRGNRVVDFNAQLKVNADKDAGGAWVQPHRGLVEGNEVFDTHARATSNPVTKLNIDGVDDWVVRANLIHDGHKNGGDGVSYQSFIKGGGKNGLYERNLVICTRDDTSGGTRIGLSFGGGGTGPQYCAPAFDPAVPCDPEMTGGVMRNNIIVACSDVGIYLNKAKDTKLLYNTLIDTSGVDFRFASSTGEADGNVMSSHVRARDGGAFTAGINLLDVADFTPWYVAPALGDLRQKGDLSALLGKGTARAEVTDDYCARARGAGPFDLGALQASLGDCDTLRPPLGGTTPGDAGADTSTTGDTGSGGGDAAKDARTDAPTDAMRDVSGDVSGDASGSDANDLDACPASQPGCPGSTFDAAVDPGGCGCRTAPSREPPLASLLSAFVLACVIRRRRRTPS